MGKLPPSPDRQPPAPRSRTVILDAEQEDPVVFGGKGESVKNSNRRRPYYFRRCKRIRSTSNTESLPGDLLFQILVQLPAQDLYDWVRLVCWKWYRMIHTHSFIYAHLHSSTSGLVIHSAYDPYRPIFVSMRQGRVEISNFNNYTITCPIFSSCNGLMVEYSWKDFKTVFISNPITRQNFKVPPFEKGIQEERLVCIAYSANSMEYKVVIPYLIGRFSECNYELYIFTLGVDESWRRLNIQHLSPQTRKLFRSMPLVTEGFIHWAMYSYHVVTMNVETEIFTETPFPIPPKVGGEEKRKTFYMSSGNDCLSLFIACGGFSWDVWEMKPETKEWRKLYNIDLESHKSELEQLGFENVESLMPNKWLNYQEAFFFHISGTWEKSEWSEEKTYYLTMYNLCRNEIQILKIHNYLPNSVLIPHRNSLVWMAGS